MSPVTVSAVRAALPPPPKYSHSRLSTYATCPYLYRRRHIDKVRSEGSEATDLGSYIHRKIAEHLSTGAPLTNDYHGEAAGSLASFRRAEAMFAALGKRLTVLRETADFKPLAVEHAFEIPLDARRILRGRIDLVAEAHGKKIVVDWKSGRLLPTRAEIEDDLQLHLYALAVPDAVEVWLWNLEHDVVVRVPVDAARVDEARRYSIALAETIETDREWKRRPNSLCASCQFVAECYGRASLPVPVGDGALALPTAAALTPEIASKVWADIEIVRAHLKVWEKRVDAARDAIEVFVDGSGPIPLGEGRVLDLRTRERRRYPLDGALRVLGEALKDCVEVKNGLVERHLKSVKATDPIRAVELSRGMSAIAEIETTTELAAGRAEDEPKPRATRKKKEATQ